MKSRGNPPAFDAWPREVLFDRLNHQGRITRVSDAETTFLGHQPGTLAGVAASDIYDESSLRRLMQRLGGEDGDRQPSALPIRMTRADGERVDVVAITIPALERGHRVLDVIKAAAPEADDDTLEMARNNEIMWSIIRKAREAIWCIRFDSPVDVTQSDDSIVDQIFSNASVWAMCNTAMARVYDLHDESELNGRSVHVHWPRNAVNEAFIREVIANRFEVEGAISEDYRRDGTPVLMENDVRAHVAGGKLHRLWGTLRELKSVPSHQLEDRARPAALGFDLLPLPACLLGEDGTPVAENMAWRMTFGAMGAVAMKMIFRSAIGRDYREFTLPLPHASGETHQHHITCRWQSPPDKAIARSGSTYLSVVTRRLDDDLLGGIS